MVSRLERQACNDRTTDCDPRRDTVLLNLSTDSVLPWFSDISSGVNRKRKM